MEPQVEPAGILEREGCSIHYWLSGPPDRPLVVFTHGAGLDHSEWDAVAPLVAERYRVLTWDVRAHGSSRPPGAGFTVPRAVDDLLALLDTLGVPVATFVGHSMGGNLHQEVVFSHPERVTALVMLGCTCNTLRLSPADALGAALAAPLLRLYPYELLKRQSADISSAKPQVRDYLYQTFSQMPKDDFVTVSAQLLRCLHYEPGYHISKPMLLTHGALDKTGNIRRVAPVWAARDAPSCRYVVIPDAGHVANLDNPDVFNRLVLDYLAERLLAGS